METNKQKKNLSDLEAKIKKVTLEKRDLKNQTEDLRVNMTKLDNQNQDLRVNMTKLDNQNQDLRVNVTKLDNQNQDLRVNMTKLDNQTRQLTAEKIDLEFNLMLFSFLFFYSYIVCQTCPKDWIQFQESCYFFYNLNSPWKTWDQSQQFCQSNKSELVVISSLEEQRFVKNTIKYYLDVYHGYWIGLQKVNNNWIWVDGSPDTLRYWMNPGSSEDFTLIVQNPALTQSWVKNRNGFSNRFICEIKSLIF
uniref:C-type lectin domain-containing protein n=1 Tax=Oryzias sinensis TaxID=183150 RepID=A0A8C7Y9L2_9TELE